MSTELDTFRQLTNGSFTLRPDGELGAADTAHGVFFGRFNGREVAVKPYKSAANAEHEAYMLGVISKIGITAVRPMQIIGAPRGHGAFLVTHRVPRLTSGASLPFVGPDQQVANSVQSVTDMARTLGVVNGKGVSLGDPEVKNFGLLRDRIDPRTSRPAIIVYDPEKGGNETVGHVKSNPFGHDVSSLTQSLAYKGFGGPDLGRAADALERHVLVPYEQQAVASGLSPRVATAAITTGYEKFIDARDKATYSAAHGGHHS